MSFTRTAYNEGRPVFTSRLDVLVFLVEVLAGLEAAESTEREASEPDAGIVADVRVARGHVEGAVRELADVENARRLVQRAQRLEDRLYEVQGHYRESQQALYDTQRELEGSEEAKAHFERQAMELLQLVNAATTPEEEAPTKRRRGPRDPLAHVRKRKTRPMWSDEELDIVRAYVSPEAAHAALVRRGITRRSPKAVELKMERLRKEDDERSGSVRRALEVGEQVRRNLGGSHDG